MNKPPYRTANHNATHHRIIARRRYNIIITSSHQIIQPSNQTASSHPYRCTVSTRSIISSYQHSIITSPHSTNVGQVISSPCFSVEGKINLQHYGSSTVQPVTQATPSPTPNWRHTPRRRGVQGYSTTCASSPHYPSIPLFSTITSPSLATSTAGGTYCEPCRGISRAAYLQHYLLRESTPTPA